MRYILSPNIQLAILRHFYCKMVFIYFGKKTIKNMSQTGCRNATTREGTNTPSPSSLVILHLGST